MDEYNDLLCQLKETQDIDEAISLGRKLDKIEQSLLSELREARHQVSDLEGKLSRINLKTNISAMHKILSNKVVSLIGVE